MNIDQTVMSLFIKFTFIQILMLKSVKLIQKLSFLIVLISSLTFHSVKSTNLLILKSKQFNQNLQSLRNLMNYRLMDRMAIMVIPLNCCCGCILEYPQNYSRIFMVSILLNWHRNQYLHSELLASSWSVSVLMIRNLIVIDQMRPLYVYALTRHCYSAMSMTTC